MTQDTINLATRLVNAGQNKKYQQGAVNPVVQRASSLVFDSVEAKQFATENRANRELFYGRRGTLTHFALQEAMCELECGAGCTLYPCGAAANANAILAFVKSGDHILMTGAAYEPTQDFCNVILKNMGVETTYYPPTIGTEITELIQKNTSVVFFESPSSITMEITDLPNMIKAIRAVAPNIVIILDNTWSAGILFPALRHGVDISIQAGTKYMVGHSDFMLGTAVSNARCWDQLRERSYLMGQMLDSDTAYMACRGLKTLGIRLKQHAESSMTVATWLANRGEVAEVLHPALPSCAGHAFYLRDFNGGNGLFSFVLHKRLSNNELALFLDHFQCFSMAYSWGGYESLILATQPEELNAIRPAGKVHFNGTLIRLHIGLEDVQDLIDDLKAGFDRINH